MLRSYVYHHTLSHWALGALNPAHVQLPPLVPLVPVPLHPPDFHPAGFQVQGWAAMPIPAPGVPWQQALQQAGIQLPPQPGDWVPVMFIRNGAISSPKPQSCTITVPWVAPISVRMNGLLSGSDQPARAGGAARPDWIPNVGQGGEADDNAPA